MARVSTEVNRLSNQSAGADLQISNVQGTPVTAPVTAPCSALVVAAAASLLVLRVCCSRAARPLHLLSYTGVLAAPMRNARGQLVAAIAGGHLPAPEWQGRAGVIVVGAGISSGLRGGARWSPAPVSMTQVPGPGRHGRRQQPKATDVSRHGACLLGAQHCQRCRASVRSRCTELFEALGLRCTERGVPLGLRRTLRLSYARRSACSLSATGTKGLLPPVEALPAAERARAHAGAVPEVRHRWSKRRAPAAHLRCPPRAAPGAIPS
jgi:hypothetical protein